MATAPKTPAPKSGGFNLTNKVGPFPIWVYMVAVLVGVYVYEKKKKSTPATPASASTGAGTGAGGTPGTGVAGPQSQLADYLAANASAATTNPQWEANAESVLVGEGYSYIQVQSALNQYLAGGVLSSVQQELVNAAIEAVGAPPSAPTTQSASTNSPTVAPAATAQPQNPQSAQTPNAGGYTYISTPQEGSNLAAEGVPIFVSVGGQGGPVVPFQSGVQYAPGSEEVYQSGSVPTT